VADGGEDGSPAIYLDKGLRDEFLAWSVAPKAEGGKGNTPPWQKYQRQCLEWWTPRLADADGRALDLRTVSREQVFRLLDGDPKAKPAIPKATGIRKKQAVLKSLYGWLRRHRRGVRIAVSEDPLADVPNLPGGVAQANGINKYVQTEHLHKVVEYLVAKGSIYGHALCVQAGTGWHTQELMRFVASGRVDPVPSYVQEPGVESVLVLPRHKSGKEHLTKAGRTVTQSARILLGVEPEGETPALDGRARTYRGKGEVRGSISESNYKKAIKAACVELKVPKFSPAFMRHTVATHAVQGGTKAAKVGEFLGHKKGSRMVDVYYATKAIPPKVPSPMDDVDAEPAASPQDDVIAALMEKVEELERRVKDAGKGTARARRRR
jgi:polyhydroxyalkanoate synthesis regulator phasin